MEFVESPFFTQLIRGYLSDEEYAALQQFLARDPDSGVLIPGTGGFRKARWADPRRQTGKRGGLRVIYFHFVGDRQIWLMTLYGKDEVADLTPDEKRALKSAVEREARERHLKRTRRK